MSVGKMFRPGLPFSPLAAGGNGVTTVTITPGRTIEGLCLGLGGTTFTYAMLTDIKVKANAKTIFNATGSQIDKINKFRGMAYPATFLPIMFTEFFGRDYVDQMAGAFDTSQGVESLTMEVTYAGATAPTLKLMLLESPPQAAGYSPVMAKVLRYPWSVGTGGQLPIQLPFGEKNGAVIKRIHIEHGVASNVTGVVVKENSIVVHDSLKLDNDSLNQLNGLTNQTTTYSIDFMADRNIKNCMDTRKDKSLELIPTFAAADSGFAIVEYLDVLGNL
jgi:hypothetical protein